MDPNRYVRGISDDFVADLTVGRLNPFLHEALINPDICLEIRKNYINLYYKGGNALKISLAGQRTNKHYVFEFDEKYCKNKDNDDNYVYIRKLNEHGRTNGQAFIEAFPKILSEMDSWFECHPKAERDFQHKLIKKNRKAPAIIDIEYGTRPIINGKPHLRKLDMIGLMPVDKKHILIIFENKFGEGSVSGTSGIKSHYEDFVAILKNPELKAAMIESAAKVMENKYYLGLSDFYVSSHDITDVEVLFLFADYNPRSSTLRSEVAKIQKTIPARLLMTTADNQVVDYQRAEDLFTYGH